MEITKQTQGKNQESVPQSSFHGTHPQRCFATKDTEYVFTWARMYFKKCHLSTQRYTFLGSLWAIKFLLCHRSQGHNSHQSWDYQSHFTYPRRSPENISYTFKEKKKFPKQYPLRNKLSKNKVTKYIFWSLQFNTWENTQRMWCRRGQQCCKAKLFQFLPYPY